MSLSDIITALEAEDPDRILPLGFRTPHSYRGDYMDLGFEPAHNITVRETLAAARSALGATYEGWKGGQFTMEGWTDCWLAEEGCCSDDSIGPVMMRLLLAPTRAEVLAEAVDVLTNRAGELHDMAEAELRRDLEDEAQMWHEAADAVRALAGRAATAEEPK